jgi:5-methylcytosine-specific restriction endonuclease McrA
MDKNTTIKLKYYTKNELDKLKIDNNQTYDVIVSDLIEDFKNSDLNSLTKPYTRYDSLFSRLIKQYFVLCNDCHNLRATQIHHIDKNPDNHILDNIALLCKTCHLKRHKKLTKTIIRRPRLRRIAGVFK